MNEVVRRGAASHEGEGGSQMFLALFWCISLLLPALMVVAEEREVRRLSLAAAEEQVHLRGREWLEKLQRNSRSESQIRELLMEFRTEALARSRRKKYPAKVDRVAVWHQGLAAWYRRRIAPFLPRHDLLFTTYPVATEPFPFVFAVDGELGWTRHPAPLFNRLIAENVSERRFRPYLKTLGGALGFPLLDSRGDRVPGYVAVQNRGGSVRGFFQMEHPNGGLSAVVELAGLPPRLGMKVQVSRPPGPGWDGGFLPLGTGKPVLSRGLRRNRALVAKLIRLLRKRSRLPEGVFLGDRQIQWGEVAIGLPYLAVVLSPPVQARTPWVSRILWCFGLLTVAVAGILAGERIFLGRGIRLSVGLIILWATLCLVFLPLLGLRLLARRAVGEYGRTMRQDLAREIHEDLLQLDGGERFLQASLVQRLRELARIRGLSQVFRKGTPPAVIRRWLKRLARAAHPPEPFPPNLRLEFIIAGDRDGFASSIGVKSALEKNNWQGSKELSEAFAPTMRKILQRRVEDASGTANLPPVQETMEAQIKADAFGEMVRTMIGPEGLISVLNRPGQVTECQTTHLRTSFLPTLLPASGSVPTHLILWTYGDWIDVGYVSWRLGDQSATSSIRILRTETPASASRNIDQRGSERGGWMVGMMGEYSSAVLLSPKFVPSQALTMAHSELQRLALGRSFQDVDAPGKPMIELMPGRNLSRFLLSRSLPTLPLEREERRLSLILTAVSGLACLIALCLAFIARRRFLEPLRLLQAGMERIVRGDFTIRLAMPARDEFGALGEAFNVMTIALEEGRLLGHFVSDSVKRAVRDQAFGEVARRGERRQATILFSGVFGFERIREARSPSGIAKILGQHLEVCSEAVADAGGEIDKVIGEKILVVFDHQRLGGPHSAWTAAERVVRALRTGMARHGLIPVMGIDAGTVIAGILGSRTVREDYTVIGDPVNLASRLAGLAKKTGGSRVVVSGRALQTAATPVDARRLAIHKVKGKLQEVEAFLLP